MTRLGVAAFFVAVFVQNAVDAFVTPTAFLVAKPPTAAPLTAVHLFPHRAGELVDTAVHNALSSPSVLLADNGGGIGETVRTIALAVTALLFLGAGILYLTASVIIPKAAEQVEEQAKELAPELWAEYEAQLKEGETLAMRPDLMQELGEKIQPLMEAKFEREYAEKQKQSGSSSSTSSTVVVEEEEETVAKETSTGTIDAVDAEIITDKKETKE